MAEAKYGTEVRSLIVPNDFILTFPLATCQEWDEYTFLRSLPSISSLSVIIKLLVKAERGWEVDMGTSVSSPVH